MYRILLSLPFSLRSSDRPIDCLKGKTVEQIIVIYNELCFVHSTQLPVSVTQLWRFSFLFYNLTKNTFLQILLLLLQLKSEWIILFLTDKQKHNSARIHRKCPCQHLLSSQSSSSCCQLYKLSPAQPCTTLSGPHGGQCWGGSEISDSILLESRYKILQSAAVYHQGII